MRVDLDYYKKANINTTYNPFPKDIFVFKTNLLRNVKKLKVVNASFFKQEGSIKFLKLFQDCAHINSLRTLDLSDKNAR